MSQTIVLVTGGNRGIGFEIVKALVEAQPDPNAQSGIGGPYHVFLCCRDIENGKSVAASLKPQHGNTVSPLQLEVTSPESISKAVATVKAEVGRIDVLVNNAGIISLAEDEITRLREALEVNTIAPLAVTSAFKPLLLTQPGQGPTKSKRIVHVSSSLGSVTTRLDPTDRYYNIGATEYRMSKAALNMLAVCNGFEMKEHGVKVFSFDPGFAATSLTDTPEERRKRGAIEPSVSAQHCRDIIEGRRDGDIKVMISVDSHTLPW